MDRPWGLWFWIMVRGRGWVRLGGWKKNFAGVVRGWVEVAWLLQHFAAAGV